MSDDYDDDGWDDFKDHDQDHEWESNDDFEDHDKDDGLSSRSTLPQNDNEEDWEAENFGDEDKSRYKRTFLPDTDQDHEPDPENEPQPWESVDDGETGVRIPLGELALREAADLGAKHGWEKAGVVDILAPIIQRYRCNGRNLERLDELMGTGVQPEALWLAACLRQLWKMNPEFSDVFLQYGCRSEPTIRIVRTYRDLSWRDAVDFAQTFEMGADEYEIESYLKDLHRVWYWRFRDNDLSHSFLEYLRSHLKLL